jgi:hypothetical protein
MGGSGYLRFGTFELPPSTRAKYDMQISCVMCLNLLIGAGLHSCDRQVIAGRAGCQRSSIVGCAEGKARLLAVVLANSLVADWGI